MDNKSSSRGKNRGDRDPSGHPGGSNATTVVQEVGNTADEDVFVAEHREGEPHYIIVLACLISNCSVALHRGWIGPGDDIPLCPDFRTTGTEITL